MASTAKVREALPGLIKRYGIKSVLDIGCGDCNWMSKLLSTMKVGWHIEYTGMEVVQELVEQNRKKYPHLRFLCGSGITTALPKADLVIARDCIVHLSHEDAARLLDNVKKSGAKYLLATTFPGLQGRESRENRSITTGEWTPCNLQAKPFSLPRPLEIVNEDCRESYPYFSDKSLGLWTLPGIRSDLNAKSLVVCVEYDDFLEITLPRNAKHFVDTLVVTSPTDKRTQAIAERCGCNVLATDAFYRYGASFNKGLAVEEGFEKLGRDGWICVWDADIVLPERWDVASADPECLYVPIRRMLADPKKFVDGMDWSNLPSPSWPNEFPGYCQIFNAAASAIQATGKPWYGIDWNHGIHRSHWCCWTNGINRKYRLNWFYRIFRPHGSDRT